MPMSWEEKVEQTAKLLEAVVNRRKFARQMISSLTESDESYDEEEHEHWAARELQLGKDHVRLEQRWFALLDENPEVTA